MSAVCPVCGGVIDHGDLVVLQDRCMVIRGDCVVRLTGQEFQIFELLLQSAPRAVRGAAMMDHLYQLRPGDEPADKIVNVTICRMRRKLKPLGMAIETSRGRGYVLQKSSVPVRVVAEVLAV